MSRARDAHRQKEAARLGSVFTGGELAHFRKRLQEERERAERDLRTLHAGRRDPLGSSVGELAVYDNHPADVGSEMFEREKDLGMSDNPRFLLREIDEATGRLEQGTYGLCQRCGRRIPSERLEAVPWAGRCRECQEEFEKRGRPAEQFRSRPGRPPEEDIISGHYGHLHGARPGTEYDGEDTWEDVAQHGTSQGPQDDPDMMDYEATRRASPGKRRYRGSPPR